MGDIDEVLGFLNRRDGAADAFHVSTYRVYIDNREITVNILDGGIDADGSRFMVEAYPSGTAAEDLDTLNPEYTLGNPEKSLKGALLNVHWNQLRVGD